MARQSTPKQQPRKRRADELIASLDEFATLCGVTRETMRSHLKSAPADADWLLARGRRGVGYQILIEGALQWWKRRSVASGEDDLRQQRLAALRLEMLGGDAGEDDLLLPGKARREEFLAGQAELAYREAMGELARVADLDAEMSNAVIDLRRHLQSVGPTIRRSFGLDRKVEDAIRDLIDERIKQFVAALDIDDRSDGAA